MLGNVEASYGFRENGYTLESPKCGMETKVRRSGPVEDA